MLGFREKVIRDSAGQGYKIMYIDATFASLNLRFLMAATL